jgi:hypothetical protein
MACGEVVPGMTEKAVGATAHIVEAVYTDEEATVWDLE